MSEVKWIDTRDLHGSDICDCPIGNKKQVLTLDQIEAWLEKQKKHPDGTGQLTINYFIDDLLAQIQAWKEQK